MSKQILLLSTLGLYFREMMGVSLHVIKLACCNLAPERSHLVVEGQSLRDPFWTRSKPFNVETRYVESSSRYVESPHLPRHSDFLKQVSLLGNSLRGIASMSIHLF